MINIIKNNFIRLFKKIDFVVSMTLFTTLAVIFGVYMSSSPTTFARVAFVGNKADVPVESQYIKVFPVEKEPPLSMLVKGTYDAVLTKESNEFKIKTIKSDDFKEKLEMVIKDPAKLENIIPQKTSAGPKIISFMMMFILLNTIGFAYLLSEDKEKGVLKRIILGPINFYQYLCANIFYCLLNAVILNLFILYVVKLIMQVDLGFTFLEYLSFLLLINFFGFCLSIFFIAVLDTADNATMINNLVVLSTTILAGSFYEFDNNNEILKNIIKYLPQKKFLLLFNSVDSGAGFNVFVPYISYILIFSIVLFLVSVFRMRKDFVRVKG